MTIAFITKYALTTGIYKVEGEVKDDMFKQLRNGSGAFDQYFFGKDWHLTEEGAIARAEEMRIRKLKSLDAQIKKISLLKFDIK